MVGLLQQHYQQLQQGSMGDYSNVYGGINNTYWQTTVSAGTSATINYDPGYYTLQQSATLSLPAPKKPDTAVDWLDRRVDEMRVKL